MTTEPVSEDIRLEIADEISNIQVGSGYESTTIGITAALEAADALMPLVARIQAQALRDAAKDAWKVWNVKPRVEDWLAARADRLEQG